MLRFDSNEIGWIRCYLLRILFLPLPSSTSFAFLLDNGRLFLPLRPYLFYPCRFPRTQPKIHPLQLTLTFHLDVCGVHVSRFHIINIEIGTQSDVSKIRSTGSKEQSSQNELLHNGKGMLNCVCVFSCIAFLGGGKKAKWNIVSNNFRDFSPEVKRCFTSAIDKFHVCIWNDVPLELLRFVANRKSLEYINGQWRPWSFAMNYFINDSNGTLANMKLNRGSSFGVLSFGQPWVGVFVMCHVEAVEHFVTAASIAHPSAITC